jgi:hypothetical protein
MYLRAICQHMCLYAQAVKQMNITNKNRLAQAKKMQHEVSLMAEVSTHRNIGEYWCAFLCTNTLPSHVNPRYISSKHTHALTRAYSLSLSYIHTHTYTHTSHALWHADLGKPLQHSHGVCPRYVCVCVYVRVRIHTHMCCFHTFYTINHMHIHIYIYVYMHTYRKIHQHHASGIREFRSTSYPGRCSVECVCVCMWILLFPRVSVLCLVTNT